MGWLETWGAAAGTGAGQLGLHEAPRCGRGGYRVNAGRKGRVAGAGATPHRPRARLSPHVPVHITLRGAAGLPSFREERMARAVGQAIRAMKVARDDFRIIEFSIQDSHLHLIAEADDERALTSAMRSLKARVTRSINGHVLRRPRGKVWGGRYHRVDLTSRRQARNALVYVLQNAHHHGVVAAGSLDPLSSARWSSRYIARAPLPADTSPCASALTFMLRRLWEGQWPGLISPSEVPERDVPARGRAKAKGSTDTSRRHERDSEAAGTGSPQRARTASDCGRR
ncbi:MAG: hypothetical protein JWP97_1002 [Labilithrix sp.]|nr:hypothetical protein [Labilithrix sp.]